MRLFGSMEVKNNNLYIGGVNCVELAKKYGTPLYVFDEELIRKNCREYYDNFKVNELGNKVAYAGKAFLTIAMCQIIKEEGLNLDVVSGGELYTAMKANFPMERIYFHGNNKTLEEIEMGMELGVGRFIVDNFHEIEMINETAKRRGKIQKVLLRITPGIEAHTHKYIRTGQIDSKFGFTLLENETLRAVEQCIKSDYIDIVGLHCHIGSQIFETTPYEEEVDIMMNIIKEIKDKLNYELDELDLGGGFGIYYKEGDLPKSTEEYCNAILNRAIPKAKELNIKLPSLGIEPGRSIIGNSGITLYSIGAIKEIPEIRKYVSVDGGMTDNIRPALYNAEYECLLAGNVKDPEEQCVTISGRCCESGDILLSDVSIPECKSGDVLAVMTTGAYGYSMCSNYNKILKPAVVLVKDGRSKLICKRQSYEDLISNELTL
ncbi:Diaminopimelate decarboxylase [Clostridium liquoris]|jgi:diaminopimelate decarboxylase|uniref:Diaminopimelate decarboxylase n=1 Tax=Clostridium liquoris TaxID=1289519 RepID=A0A2T0B2V0_9CLOT|nr:diaminopimelate decarboxylase [Clostridium liquoris]PRR78186.1 Diaminopimelate decarboxylase [Clostridium liquoris]